MNFSIITCSYNPNKEVFEKLISGIAALNLPKNCPFEWIIVDNNSERSIETTFDFSCIQNVVHFIESRQGLTASRISGIKKAQYDHIVFFDDDNMPQKDYLSQLRELIQENQKVACWGPGVIHVNFVGKVDDTWILINKGIFQEKTVPGKTITAQQSWSKFHPQGTGLYCQKKALDFYIKQVESGEFSISDREGQSLSSAGDVQIVLSVIKQGFEVGISDQLQLRHNIENKKATFEYVLKLIYGMASYNILAFNQVYPDKAHSFVKKSNLNIIQLVINHIRYYKLKLLKRDAILRLVQQLGDINARYVAYPAHKRPFMIKILEKMVVHV